MNERVLQGDLVAPSLPRAAARARRRGLLLAGGLVVLLAAAWGGWRWWKVGRFIETTDDAYVGGNVTAIAPHVAGFVAAIPVVDNQYVHAGQLLVRLEGRDARAAEARARAGRDARAAASAAADAGILLQHALIRADAAGLAGARARARFADQDAARYRALARTAAGTRQAAQRTTAAAAAARAAVGIAAANLAAANTKLAVLRANAAEAAAARGEAAAALATARLDLGYTEIRAPVDGYIGDRAAQIGAYVTPGTVLMSVVPARGLWIDANFKEDALARMRAGQPVTIVADALPGRVLHGHLGSLAPATGAVFSVIPPQNATGNFTRIVQRVPVRILLDGRAARLGWLRPGLSATVSVDTRRQPRR